MDIKVDQMYFIFFNKRKIDSFMGEYMHTQCSLNLKTILQSSILYGILFAGRRI